MGYSRHLLKVDFPKSQALLKKMQKRPNFDQFANSSRKFTDTAEHLLAYGRYSECNI